MAGPGLCEPAEWRAERDQLGPQQRARHQRALPLAVLRPVVLPPLQHPPGRPRPPALIPVGEYTAVIDIKYWNIDISIWNHKIL